MKRGTSKRFTKNLFAEVPVEGEEPDTVLHVHNTLNNISKIIRIHIFVKLQRLTFHQSAIISFSAIGKQLELFLQLLLLLHLQRFLY